MELAERARFWRDAVFTQPRQIFKIECTRAYPFIGELPLVRRRVKRAVWASRVYQRMSLRDKIRNMRRIMRIEVKQ